MALLSEIIKESSGIPKEYRKEAAVCCNCGEKISHGGMWAMYEHHIGICKKCSTSLLDWYIDTLIDTGEIDEVDDIKNVKRLTNDIIDRYKKKHDQKLRLGKKHM